MEFLASLTRSHGIRVESQVGVEECSLAVGEVVGHEHVLSGSRMNKAIVLFLSSVDKADLAIQHGVVIRDSLIPVHPLSSPSRKILLSNVPPFLSDAQIIKELSSFGKVVSPIKKLPVGCKSPKLKHLLSFRRQVYMVLSGHRSELDVKFNFTVGSFSYLVYVTSNVSIKCFRCGKVGHQRQDCTNDRSGNAGQAGQSTAQAEVAAAADSAERTSEATTSKSNTADSPVISPTTDSHTDETPATKSNETESPVIETLITGPNVPTPSTAEPSESDTPAAEVPASLAEHSPETPVETGLRADGAGVEEANRSKPVYKPESAEAVPGPFSGGSDTGLNQNAHPLDEMINKEVAEMETEFKKPTCKRKSKDKENNSVKVKKGESGTEGASEAEGYSSDSSWSECSQTDVPTVVYTAEEIMLFLLKTKGQRDVRVVDYFPNKQQFVRDGTFWMREGEIPKPECYRLRQRVSEVRKELRNANVAS